MNLKKYRKFARALTDFIFADDRILSSDVIFVPGNGYPQMAEEAARLYKTGFAPIVLPSGKWYIGDGRFMGIQPGFPQYDGCYGTEWEFLKDVLMKNGVPEEAILREDASRFTYENAINSRKVTDAEGITVRRGIVCVNAIHARRCRMYYELLYPDAEILVHAVPANGITRENWLTKAEYIDAVTSEAERCSTQFTSILKELADRYEPS